MVGLSKNNEKNSPTELWFGRTYFISPHNTNPTSYISFTFHFIPYSQKTNIKLRDGQTQEINYIRNSLKVLIDAYDGTTTFYITDKSDPIIMTYRNIYPELFSENEIPADIAAHFVYPKFLYNIQSDIISTYHDVSEDTLYRADDIWEITRKSSI